MFCPNCGNKVSADDNYCKVCGKNLKNVKIIITKEDSKPAETKKSFDQSTRIFKPIKNLNGIDNTNDLKDIINEVDKKISQNISEYKTNLNKPENMQGPEKSFNKDIQDLSKIKSTTNTIPTKPISEEAFPLEGNNDKARVEPSKIKERKSLKEIWQDFINEDDDQYSIFGNFDKESSAKKKKDVKIATTTSTPTTMENTMDIPLKDIEEALSSSKSEKSATKSSPLKDTVEVTDEATEDLNTNIIFDENNRNFHISGRESKNYVEKKYSKSYNYKDFTDLVNSQLNKQDTDEPVSEKKSDFKLSLKEKFRNFKNSMTLKKLEFEKNQEEIKHEVKEVKDKKSNKKPIEEIKATETFEKKEEPVEQTVTINIKDENSKERTKTPEEKISPNKAQSKSLFDGIFSSMNGIYVNLESVLDSKLNISVFLLGAVATVAPVFIAARELTGALIFLCIIKLALKILQYFMALKVTTDKAWIETERKEIFSLSLFNFMVCELFLLIAFVFSPWQGFFNFSLISALTPLPIAIILVCLLSIAIAVSLYWSQLKDERKLDFIAWYIITFLIVEFISKIFFIISNLVITQ